MIVPLIVITFFAVLGNYGIAKYKRTGLYPWVALSLVVGPLSWPLQWHSTHIE
jgi:hypothetical protein